MPNHTDYKYFIGDLKVPWFVETIFSLRKISDSEKIKFRDKFLNKYLEDYEFQKAVEGCYIHILNDKFFGVYNTNSRLEVEGNEIVEIIKINYEAQFYNINYIGQTTIPITYINEEGASPIILDIKHTDTTLSESII